MSNPCDQNGQRTPGVASTGDGPQPANELIAAGKTILQRMLSFLGDIPFGDLFGGPWKDLSGKLQWDAVHFEDDRRQALHTFKEVLENQQYRGMSFHQLLNQDYDRTPQPVYEAVQQLWFIAGILLPWPVGSPGLSPAENRALTEPVRAALNDLLDNDTTRQLTYAEIYGSERKAVRYSAGSLRALNRAIQNGVLYARPDWTCCYNGSCYPSPYSGYCNNCNTPCTKCRKPRLVAMREEA